MKVTIAFFTDYPTFRDWESEVDFVMERATQLVKEKDSFVLLDSAGNEVGEVIIDEEV